MKLSVRPRSELGRVLKSIVLIATLLSIALVVYRVSDRREITGSDSVRFHDSDSTKSRTVDASTAERELPSLVNRADQEEFVTRDPIEPAPPVPPKLTDFDDSSRLSRIKWSFSRKIPNHEKVLANDYFNPEKKRFTDESAYELDRILDDLIRQEKEMDTAYNTERKAHMKSRLEEGRYEVQPMGDTGLSQSRPTNPEEEVLGVSSTKYGNCLVRINWGDSPTIDQKRQEVLDFKTRSVATIREFVRENAK